MKSPLPLKVFKTRPASWRVNLGGAHFGPLDAWNVATCEGELLAGDLCERGSNVQTARALFPRKRDALAYAAGFEAWLRKQITEEDLIGSMLRMELVRAKVNAAFPVVSIYDERLERAYERGVQGARSFERRQDQALSKAPRP